MNMLAIPLVPLTMMLISTFLNAQVIFLLSSPDYFDVPADDIGYVASMLIFLSFPGAIIGTFFIGFAYDILGRKWTLFISFMCAAIILSAIPWTAPNVLPWLLVCRMLIQITFCAPAASPLPADYIHKESLGIGSAMQGIGFILGEVISMGVLFRITDIVKPEWGFGIVSILVIIIAFSLLFMITEAKLR